MLLLYTIAVRFYYIAVWVAAKWNAKAAAWVQGRKKVFSTLEGSISPTDKIIWFHCSSAGEFEQGKPVIEALKELYTDCKILITFFSPSGYSVAINYASADIVTYLPLDTKANARRFIQTVQPALAVFVKYEFWYYHLEALAKQRIPTLLISAAFRKDQIFFRWYGGFFQKMLQRFTQVFVQTAASRAILTQHRFGNVIVAGDTRFDRVHQIVNSSAALPPIEAFIETALVIVAGSTWQNDERMLSAVWTHFSTRNIKLIIAPHQIHFSHIQEVISYFPQAILFSALQSNPKLTSAQVLIIDNMGMLSKLYRYAAITYVGGGFTKDGIHNILEAAVWDKPVVFGPNYYKYTEAEELIAKSGGFSFTTAEELKKLAGELLSDEAHRQSVGQKAGRFVKEHTGATRKIIAYIQENRLLTKE